jgi:hypothetical protein
MKSKTPWESAASDSFKSFVIGEAKTCKQLTLYAYGFETEAICTEGQGFNSEKGPTKGCTTVIIIIIIIIKKIPSYAFIPYCLNKLRAGAFSPCPLLLQIAATHLLVVNNDG